MITTDCDKCKYLQHNNIGKHCTQNQMCFNSNQKCFTIGYCRHFSNKKIDKDNTCKLHLFIELQHNYNLDTIIDNIKELRQCDRFNLIDKVTLFSYEESIKDKNDIKKLVKNNINYNHDIEGSRSLYHRINQVLDTTKYNLIVVIPSNKKIINFNYIYKYLKLQDSRAVFWYFQEKFGDTIMCRKNPVYGIYIREVFKWLYNSQDIPFSQVLEQDNCEFLMSWMMDGVYLV